MERKFVRSKKAQRATELRINASASIQENRPVFGESDVQPIDYEKFVEENTVLLRGDHQKEVITFPNDDFQVHKIANSRSTVENPVLKINGIKSCRDPFVKQCAEFFASDFEVVVFKDIEYSGSYFTLPGPRKESSLDGSFSGSSNGRLPSQRFEFDDDNDSVDSDVKGSLAKQGYLWKTPFNLRGEKQSVFTKSAFKRRLFSLHQLPDKTYTLNYSKDDRKDLKGSVHLGGCVSVIKSSAAAAAAAGARSGQNRRWAFELHLASKHILNLAAESQSEQEEWVSVLQSAINCASSADASSIVTSGSTEDTGYDSDSTDAPPEPPTPAVHQSNGSGLGSEIQRYCKETDRTISEARKQHRQNVFSLYNNLQQSIDQPECWDNVRRRGCSPSGGGGGGGGSLPFQTNVFPKLLFTFQELNFRLKVAHEGTKLDNGQNQVEPFFATLALYDIGGEKKERKITEDVSIDVNPRAVWKMMRDPAAAAAAAAAAACDVGRSHDDLIESYVTQNDSLQFLRQVVFSLRESKRLHDVYLHIRIDKILQGAISQSFDLYCKSMSGGGGDQEKLVHKTLKQVQMFCAKFGSRFRTPFCWAAIRLADCVAGSTGSTHSLPLFRVDHSKLNEESVLRNLADLRSCIDKPDKLASRFAVIPGASIKANICQFDSPLINCVNSSLVQLKPKIEECEEFAREAQTFVEPDCYSDQPLTEYVNLLYLSSLSLKFDSQKAFAKARNIACCVQLLHDDTCQTNPSRAIYGRAGEPVLTTLYTTTVTHHNTSPDFSDEIKIQLPNHVLPSHHLLFTFYHVSCDQVVKLNSSSKKQASMGMPAGSALETNVGYAWVKLLKRPGLLVDGRVSLPVATTVAPGYLSVVPGTGGRSNSISAAAPDEPAAAAPPPPFKFVEGGKPLFSLKLNVQSSVFPSSNFTANFFHFPIQPAVQHPRPPRTPVAAASSENPPCEKDPATPTATASVNNEFLTHVKALHAVEEAELIRFLPVFFNRIFQLMATTSSDVQINLMRLLIHIVGSLDRIGRSDLVRWYVGYVFTTSPSAPAIHQQVVSSVIALIKFSSGDENFLHHFYHFCWLFFDVTLKSMALSVLKQHKLSLPRTHWFPRAAADAGGFVGSVEQLVEAFSEDLFEKQKRIPHSAFAANYNLALFIKGLFSVMDRGAVFKLVNLYLDRFRHLTSADGKGMVRMRSEFLRVVCEHEHFVQLNLPLLGSKPYNASSLKVFLTLDMLKLKDMQLELSLSDDFLSKHFLVGLMLKELTMCLLDIPKIRRQAVTLLRNTLAKVASDPRWSPESKQSRIVNLFIPFLSVLTENVGRLHSRREPPPPPAHSAPATTVSHGESMESLAVSEMSHATTDLGGGDTDTVIRAATSDATLHQLPDDCPVSQQQQHRRKSSAAAAVRFDQLEENETKDLLVCFLHILKFLNPEMVTKWWELISDDEQNAFLSLLSISLTTFQYSPAAAPLLPPPTPSSASHHRRTQTFTCDSWNPEELSSAAALGGGGGGGKGSVRLKLAGRADSLGLNPPGQGGSPRKGGSSNSYSLITPSDLELGDRRKVSAAAVATPVPAHRASQPSSSAAAEMWAENELVSLKDANLATEAGLVVLDTMDALSANCRRKFEVLDSTNCTLSHLFDLYLGFLRSNHSETLLKHAFASIRALISKFPMMLFKGDTGLCGRMCYEMIRCFSSRLETTRHQSCMLLYLLMRSNFIFTGRTNCTRVHLQAIVAVSQLIGDVVVTSSPRFQDSLALVNNLSSSDRGMQHSKLPKAVAELTRTMRKVLMATAQMKEHEAEPEMLVHLQHSLADSYSGTPELRLTWLESMARVHSKLGFHSEVAMCHLHVAALMADILHAQGTIADDSRRRVLATISPNVLAELAETAGGGQVDHSFPHDDSGGGFTEDNFIRRLESVRESLDRAERYELVPKLYHILQPYYERRRDYAKLIQMHSQCSECYQKMMSIYSSGRRFLATYFRVSFFGKVFGCDDGCEYIYKEPHVTSLGTITERLSAMYSEKLGPDNFRLITDSSAPLRSDMDPKVGYLQVTFVEPHLEEPADQLASGGGSAGGGGADTDFDRHNNICKFVYEVPFTPGGKSHGQLHEQHIKKTVIKTKSCFPYVEKRIAVDVTQSFQLSPIEVACESLRRSVLDLRRLTAKNKQPDMKRLQLKLQGCVSTQVNAGPLAYARTFLDKERQDQFPANQVKELKKIYVQFVDVCWEALELNGRLIKSDQLEFHDNLRLGFRNMVHHLTPLLDTPLLLHQSSSESAAESNGGDRNSLHILSAISNTTFPNPTNK